MSVGDEIPAALSRREEAELYRRHHCNLERAVSDAVSAPRELIEDACQNAWTTLLRAKPDCTSVFGWLYDVATREARRLCRAERRYTDLDASVPARSREAVRADAFCVDEIIEAREALDILASLPNRQRKDLSLLVAGFTYDEIARMTGRRTFSTVRKNVAKARARVRQARMQEVAPWASPDRHPGQAVAPPPAGRILNEQFRKPRPRSW